MTNFFWLENLKRQVTGLLLLMAMALALAPTTQAQVYGVTSYPVPNGAYGGSNIATASDGTLWFLSIINGEGAQYEANEIAADGTVTQYSLANVPSPVGSSITAGPDGTLWFTAGGPATGAFLVKMSTKGTFTLIPVSGNSGTFAYAPGAIVTGPDQNIWFTDAANPQLNVYSPANNTFTAIPLTNPAFGIGVGPDGNIWATEYLVAQDPSDPYDYLWSGSVAKVTPQGVVAEYAFPQQNIAIFSHYESPIDVFATGSDGALWFTEYDGGQVGRVTTDGTVTTPYQGFANGITAGPDGALWITQPGSDSESTGPALVQLTTSGATNSYALGTAFSKPTGITVGSDGTLWFDDISASVIGQAALTLAITTTTLPNGSVGTAYNSTLQAEGGRSPYSWSVPPSSLPTGLQLSSAGVISGTPTTVGTATFTVTATDSAAPAQTATQSLSITIAAGAPTTIAATSGSGQNAQVNTAFGSPLTATVMDSGNNPVPGASVTFTAPGSGASGTFTGGGVTATVATNASGVATSPTFTANATAGGYSVSASVPGVPGSAPFALTNNAGAAGSITATSGGGQSAQINSAFSSSLVATVLDASNNPVPNASVTFTAPGSGASGTFAGSGTTATVQTNASGVATAPTFTANASAGGYTVTAAVSGVSTQAPFALTNTAGGPASITATSGGGQSAPINSAFGSPLVVIIKDAGGNPVANVSVTFAAPGSGASGAFVGAGTTVPETTNAAGMATSPGFVANGTAGSYVVSASVAGVTGSAGFNLNNTAGPPASITVTAGSGQSAQINSPFSSALVAIVKDAGNNVVPNAGVTFSAPGSGASGTFSGGGATIGVNTNSAGVATSPTFTANATAGPYTVSATVAGVTTPATFALTNTAGAPASITATSGGGQSAQANSAFGAPLVAIVKDSGNNPVSNATVTFTAPAGGVASGTFPGGALTSIVQTNASGVATSPTFTANGTAGGYTVNAAVTGVTTQAGFALTNTAGNPASITATSGGGQTAQIKTAFVSALVVIVKDASSNPVPNVTVTFSTPGSGASATFAGGGTTAPATTNSSGVATSPALSANGTAGSFSASASVSGVTAAATFPLNNTAGAPGSITVTSGSGQFARINTPFAYPLVVTVTDSSGNAVANATVTYTAPSSGPSGTFAGTGVTATATTNASGVATSPTFTANGNASVSGGYQITASVSGAASPAIFLLNNNAGTPASITASSGGGQTARVNTAFNNPFVVTVKDSGSNPVSGASVTFTAPGTGASGTFAGGGTTATAQTNSSGVATSPAFTANGTTGNYSVTATVTGVSASALFALTNSAGTPGSITATSGTPQSAVASTAFSAPMVVLVKDSNGNVVSNATVTFSAPVSGASGTFPGGALTAMAVTNASGVATSPAFTANAIAGGPYTVSASVAGAAAPATFLLTNTPGSVPITPTFTFNGIPSTQTPGTSITNATVQLTPESSTAFAGMLTLSFTPNPTYSTGLPDGYTGDAGFVSSTGTKSTTSSVAIPAMTTSVALPTIDPGTVAGSLAINLAIPGQAGTTSTITVPAAGPIIEANSVQITNVTSTGFDVELVATSTTRELTNAIFTFTPAAGATISGTTTFTVDVSSLLSSWFTNASSLPYGGAFTLTLPFSLTGSASAIQSVSVTLSNSIGTSAAVSGTQ